MISTPVKNVGSEVPISTKTVLALSKNFPRCLAAKIPRLTPTSIHKKKAPSARLRVTGKVLAINSDTH